MKYFIICFLAPTLVWSQQNVIWNGDFENISTGCADCSIMGQGCVRWWNSSHGSPHVQTDVDNNNIAMWSRSSSTGEGMFQDVPFYRGVNYQIKLRAKKHGNANKATFVVSLSNNLDAQPGYCGGGNLPSVDVLQLATETTYSVSWTEYQWSTGILDENFNQLWVYALNHNNPNVVEWISIDDVEVTYDCLDEVFYQNTSSLPLRTKVSNKIVAGKSVTSGNIGPVVVTNGQEVFFESGSQILLKDGFTAEPGSSFIAAIVPCDQFWDWRPRIPVRIGYGINSFYVALGDSLSNNFVSDEIIAYPNPVRDILSIQYNTLTNDPVNISILDLSGARVLTTQVVPDISRRIHKTTLDLSNLINGIYILEVFIEAKSYYQKIIIEQ